MLSVKIDAISGKEEQSKKGKARRQSGKVTTNIKVGSNPNFL